MQDTQVLLMPSGSVHPTSPRQGPGNRGDLGTKKTGGSYKVSSDRTGGLSKGQGGLGTSVLQANKLHVLFKSSELFSHLLSREH